MKLKAMIIDDEPLAHEIIVKYLHDIPFVNLVSQCYLATEALTVLNKEPIDLIFLDINMPKLKGIDFLKILNTKPLVIITSAYEEYAMEGFELDVCDYLLKPFRFDRFLKAVNKAHNYFNMTKNVNKPIIETIATEEAQSLFIKVDKKLVQLEIQKIHFIEAYGNYVKVWTDKNYYLTPRTLISFEEQLSNSGFIRIHKSYIVQKNHISYIEFSNVHMMNQKVLPLGKNFKHLSKQLK